MEATDRLTSPVASESAITVIIPTTCELGRWVSLRRAIASVRAQGDVGVELLVVVNGTRCDMSCLDELCSMSGLRVEYLEEANLPQAVRHGRMLVSTPFFSFLDDDDEYLPNVLQMRIQPMLEDQTLGFVVSNGYMHVNGYEELAVRDVAAIQRDPLQAMLGENWLASCGGVFRASRVTSDFFDGTTKYFEWTLLAFRLASAMKMHFLDTPTFRIHDTSGSLSKSDEYRNAETDVLMKILDLNLPGQIRIGLMVKLGNAYHCLSSYYRKKGEFRRAWRFHIASLRFPGGLRYLIYTRKLLPFKQTK